MLVLGGIRVRQSQSLQEMQAPVGDVLAADLNETLASNPTSMLGRINELGAAQLPEGAFDNAPIGIYGEPSLEPMPSPNLDASTARQRVKDAGLEGLIACRAMKACLRRSRSTPTGWSWRSRSSTTPARS